MPRLHSTKAGHCQLRLRSIGILRGVAFDQVPDMVDAEQIDQGSPSLLVAPRDRDILYAAVLDHWTTFPFMRIVLSVLVSLARISSLLQPIKGTGSRRVRPGALRHVKLQREAFHRPEHQNPNC